jgi:hypothetical protein
MTAPRVKASPPCRLPSGGPTPGWNYGTPGGFPDNAGPPAYNELDNRG